MKPYGVVLLLLAGAVGGPEPAASGAPISPLSGFQPNHGQFASPAAFVGHAGALRVSLEAGAVLAQMPGRTPRSGPVSVRMRLVGSDARARLQPQGPLPGRTHYLRGADPAAWIRDVPSYADVRYRAVYPGIDLVLRSDGERVAYDFVLAPGADHRDIRLAFEGAAPRLDAGGDLVLDTPAGPLRQRRPRLYQGAREVDGRFVVDGWRRVRFEVGSYDPGQTLLIDPELVYSTYFGGARGFQGLLDVAADAKGSAYVTGYYPWDGDRGLPDQYVAKFGPAGEHQFTAFLLGGNWADSGAAVAVGADGTIYLAGATASDACCRPFPVVNAFQAANAGGTDAFLQRLSADGRTLLYSTFLGGSGEDMARDLAVDGEGRVYLAGTTSSPNFPTANAAQPALAGSRDAFVTVFSPGCASLAFSTYVGGSGDDSAARLALAAPALFLAGTTSSVDLRTRAGRPRLPFPGAVPFQRAYGGGASDAFTARLGAGGALEALSYLGGSGRDQAYGVAADPSGFPLVAGSTDSTDFPTRRALQPALSFPPEADAFLARLLPGLDGAAYSTYLALRQAATCSGAPTVPPPPCGDVAVDAAGDAFVTAPGTFVIKVAAEGRKRAYTFNGFGGHGMTVSPDGHLLVAGRTASFLFPTVRAFDPVHQPIETEEGWLAKLADVPNPGAAVEEDSPRFTYTGEWEVDVSLQHSGGTARRSRQPGARVTITVAGGGIQVLGRRDPAAGVARVSIANNPFIQGFSSDTFAPITEARALLFSFSGATLTGPTVTLEVAGTSSPRATDHWVWIDGLTDLP